MEVLQTNTSTPLLQPFYSKVFSYLGHNEYFASLFGMYKNKNNYIETLSK